MRQSSNSVNDQNRVPRPRHIREVPGYLKTLISVFFGRLFYIFRLVWETKPSLLFAMVFICVFNGVTPVVGSLISARILNTLSQVYAGADLAFRVIAVLLVAQFAYTFLTGAVSRLYNLFSGICGELVSNHVKQKIMDKAKQVDMVSFDSPDFYAKMENAGREASSRPIQILSSAFSVGSTLISMLSFIVILFRVNRWASPLIIAVSIPATIVNFVYRRKRVDYMFRRSRNRREMDYYFSSLTNKDLVKEMRMFGLGDAFTKKYQDAFGTYFQGLKSLQLQECLWNLGATVLTSSAYCLLYIFLARGVWAGQFAVGDFSLYTGAIMSIGGGVGTLITTTASIYEGTLFINNLISFMNEQPSIVPSVSPAAKVTRHAEHTIVFEHVYFRYPGCERDILQDVNLTIHPGQTVVIVGLNGAGKTTLVKLLTRLYDPTSCRILLDGRDIREYDVQELYALFGIIFQDFGKYAVSARENILFGDLRRDVNENAIREAAAESGADGFIQALPQGYDTPLMRYFDPAGAELSIGQWQKLSIARAFYADSDILILDEPTASLDPMAEQEIFQQFNTLRSGKTSVFISHRLSSATIADQILVMENGQIIESGTHEELMALGGRYCELFTVQAERYQVA